MKEKKKKKKKKKIGEKEEKKDRCMHRVFSPFLNTLYFNIVNLWNIRWRVSHNEERNRRTAI